MILITGCRICDANPEPTDVPGGRSIGTCPHTPAQRRGEKP